MRLLTARTEHVVSQRAEAALVPPATAVLLLSVLVLVPSGTTAWLRRFDGLYGQDAYAYFTYATGPLRDALLRAESPAQWPSFFWPPGYPLLVAMVSFVLGPTPLAGQLVSLFMGALVPIFTALLTRELFDDEQILPLLAGGLVALSGQLWQSSMVVMADTTGLALATLGAWSLARYARTGRVTWLLIASGAVAFAVLTRWIYALVAIPFSAFAVFHLRRPAHLLAGIAIGAAVLVPLLGPPLLAFLREPVAPASFAGNLQVYSWSPLNALQREFSTPDGQLRYALPNGAYYALAPGNLAFFGPLLAPWIAVGIWAAARGWRLPSVILIVGWAAIVFAFHAGAPWQNFRFTLAYLPPLAILAATGLVWFARRINPRLGIAVSALAALGLVAMAIGGARLVQGFVDRKDADLAMVQWVEAQAPPGARLLSFGPTLTFQQYSRLPTTEIFELEPPRLPDLLSTPDPTYVLLDEANVADQWRGRAPDQVLQWLRDVRGLTRLGNFGSYSLFRVGSA